MQSKELFTIDATPGLFTTDSPLANPYPDELRAYTDKDADTWDSAVSIRNTKSFFLPGAWSAKNDLNSDDVAWHMYSGMRQGFNLNYPGKKFNDYGGYGNLFSSVLPEHYRIGNEQDWDIKQGYGMKRANLEVYTQHEMTHSAGLLLGSRYIDDALDSTARWMSPVGIQFKWHNVFSKAKAVGQRIKYLFLMYHDNWAPSKLLYAPIIYGGTKTNSSTFIKGNDILSTDKNENGSDQGGHSVGQFVGFVDPNSMSVIKDRYTNSACVGIYLAMENVKNDGAPYDKVINFWDFKPLFDVSSNQSRIVVPTPHSLRERMETNSVKLL